MKTRAVPVFWVVVGLLLPSTVPVEGQDLSPAPSNEAATVEAATQVLNEIMAVPVKQIPTALLADAQGVAIIPNVVKGGLIVGVRHGRGVVVVRDEAGRWRPPAFVSITGGSVGWQVGVQSTDVILVFKTQNGVRGLTKGKVTIGADAAVAAGPVGRQAAAATDIELKAEVLSYSRSRGLFAGVALDGSALEIENAATAAYYRGTGVSAQPGQAAPLPPSAVRLVEQLAKYSTRPTAAAAAGPALAGPMIVPAAPAAAADAQETREQLAKSSQQLGALLDESWRRFLALPAEVYGGDRPPTADALGQSLSKFEAVLKNPQYRPLAQRAEFQATYGLLKKYRALQIPQAAPLSLPPPPR